MISKTGTLYYTEDEMKLALQNNNALEYALNNGYDLVKHGGYYKMRDHDSLVFTPEGKFHWNSQSVSGDALDFIKHYEKRSTVEAVLILAGTMGYTPSAQTKAVIKATTKEKPVLVIPGHAKNNDKVFAYLIKTRGISPQLVSQLVAEHKIYQSDKYDNLVMVGHDSSSNPKYISLRSTNTLLEKPFKGDVVGSDKSYPFVIDGKQGKAADTVCVFESPIEAMSYNTLCELLGSANINFPMISIGGSSVIVALERYLKDNPQIKNIILSLNNDKDHAINAGEKGTLKKIEVFGDKYNIKVHKPHLNDWNDVLRNYRDKQLGKTIGNIKQPQKQQQKHNSLER